MADLRLLGTYSVYFYSLIFLNISLDGVTVAQFITLKDKFENLGARYVLMFLHVSHTNHTQLLVLSKMSLKKRTKWLEMVLQQLPFLLVPSTPKEQKT